MVEEGQRDPEFEAILDSVDPNRFVHKLMHKLANILRLLLDNRHTAPKLTQFSPADGFCEGRDAPIHWLDN